MAEIIQLLDLMLPSVRNFSIPDQRKKNYEVYSKRPINWKSSLVVVLQNTEPKYTCRVILTLYDLLN